MRKSESKAAIKSKLDDIRAFAKTFKPSLGRTKTENIYVDTSIMDQQQIEQNAIKSFDEKLDLSS